MKAMFCFLLAFTFIGQAVAASDSSPSRYTCELIYGTSDGREPTRIPGIEIRRSDVSASDQQKGKYPRAAKVKLRNPGEDLEFDLVRVMKGQKLVYFMLRSAVYRRNPDHTSDNLGEAHFYADRLPGSFFLPIFGGEYYYNMHCRSATTGRSDDESERR